MDDEPFFERYFLSLSYVQVVQDVLSFAFSELVQNVKTINGFNKSNALDERSDRTNAMIERVVR